MLAPMSTGRTRATAISRAASAGVATAIAGGAARTGPGAFGAGGGEAAHQRFAVPISATGAITAAVLSLLSVLLSN